MYELRVFGDECAFKYAVNTVCLLYFNKVMRHLWFFGIIVRYLLTFYKVKKYLWSFRRVTSELGRFTCLERCFHLLKILAAINLDCYNQIRICK